MAAKSTKKQEAESTPETLPQPDSVLPEAGEPTQAETSETTSESVVSQGTYATEYFKNNGIPYCDRCGSQLHTDAEGKPVCAESVLDCPLIV